MSRVKLPSNNKFTDTKRYFNTKSFEKTFISNCWLLKSLTISLSVLTFFPWRLPTILENVRQITRIFGKFLHNFRLNITWYKPHLKKITKKYVIHIPCLFYSIKNLFKLLSKYTVLSISIHYSIYSRFLIYLWVNLWHSPTF